jgi:UDP-glucose 4-epimerase
MQVLVTGGTGYIGSHTVVQLLNAGFEVVVIDNLSNSSSVVCDKIRSLTGKDFVFIDGDIRDISKLVDVFRRFEFISVLHFAGLKSVGESASMPITYYENNVAGLLVLLRVMVDYNVKSLIFSSSATVYGTPLSLPLTESTPLGEVTNPYGMSKLVCEKILQDLCRSDHSWDIACLRYFNPVGADPSGLIGEDPLGVPTNLMPVVCQVAAGLVDKVIVFGGDYNTPDGTGVRDYIHVVDLAKGHVKALDYISVPRGFQIFNLGTGIGYSVLEIISEFETQSGLKIPFEISDRRIGDVAECYASVDRANSLLHWHAELGLSSMCEDTWRWKSINPAGYR